MALSSSGGMSVYSKSVGRASGGDVNITRFVWGGLYSYAAHAAKRKRKAIWKMRFFVIIP